MQRLTAGITDTRAMLAIIMRLTSRAPVHAFVRRLGIFASSLFFSFPSLFPEFWAFHYLPSYMSHSLLHSARTHILLLALLLVSFL
jgi:hypothetical protein